MRPLLLTAFLLTLACAGNRPVAVTAATRPARHSRE